MEICKRSVEGWVRFWRLQTFGPLFGLFTFLEIGMKGGVVTATRVAAAPFARITPFHLGYFNEARFVRRLMCSDDVEVHTDYFWGLSVKHFPLVPQYVLFSCRSKINLR